MKKQSIFAQLQDRGFVYQGTNIQDIQDILDNHRIVFYLGVDPTAQSLHIGHLVTLMMFKRLQDFGHQGILLLGGATGLVGDPSGKQELRQMMTNDTVVLNIDSIQKSAERFIATSNDNQAIIANNADWFRDINFVDFMRNIGVHFNVNKMLAAEAYLNRLDNGGLTFLEMSYMLMQGYDFVQLNQIHNCTLQIGGSDQWGNIVAGTRLYRKIKFGNDEHCDTQDKLQNIYGLTCPLLLTKSGKKMGKTEKGTLWLDPTKTTPYEFYQYFYNVDDQDVSKLLKMFSNIDTREIEHLVSTDIIQAKKTMAYELTTLVHGKSIADQCVTTSVSLFGSNVLDISNAPTIQLELQQLQNGINITQLCVLSKSTDSTTQARRLIESGAISLNNTKVTDTKYTVTNIDLIDNSILLKKGKKHFVKIVFV